MRVDVQLLRGRTPAALLVLFVACQSREPSPVRAVASSTVAVANTAAPMDAMVDAPPGDGGASSPAAPSPDAGRTDDPPLLDTPGWPTGVKKMRLTWVLYPVVSRDNDPAPARRVELVVRANAVARRLATEVTGSVGYLTSMQPDCQRLPGEAIKSARLFLNGGGNTELIADRHGDELWLSVSTSSDGLCEPDPCPSTDTLVGRMSLPADVVFE
ncbi:MAG TPA: hypothetical protein VIF09_05595 [Polyangiaceae bacterium]